MLASVLHAASAPGLVHACGFSTLRLAAAIARNRNVQKKDGMTPHAFHILESRRTKPPQTMKLVLALAGTAAAFVAPVRRAASGPSSLKFGCVHAELEPWMSKQWIAALARRRRLRRPTRCVAVILRPPLGRLQLKFPREKPIQLCQRVLCSDVVEAANLAIPPPARRSGVAGPARERVASDAVDAAATRRDW